MNSRRLPTSKHNWAQAREGLKRDAIAKCEDAERQIQRHADNVADLRL